MSVLGLNSKDWNSTRDKANISNPKVNRGCAYSQPTTSQQTVCKFHLDPQYHIFHWGSTTLGDSTLWWAHSYSLPPTPNSVGRVQQSLFTEANDQFWDKIALTWMRRTHCWEVSIGSGNGLLPSAICWCRPRCKAMKAIYIIYLHGATSIPLWISNHMLNKVWDEINHLFTNFNDCTFQIWKWINNFIPHFIMDIYLSSLLGRTWKKNTFLIDSYLIFKSLRNPVLKLDNIVDIIIYPWWDYS